MSAAVYMYVIFFFSRPPKSEKRSGKGTREGVLARVVVLNVGVGEITGKAKGAKTGPMLVAGEGRKRRN